MNANPDEFINNQNFMTYDLSLAYQYPTFAGPNMLPQLPFSPCKKHVMRGRNGYDFDYATAPIADLQYTDPIIPLAPGMPGPNLKPYHPNLIIDEIIIPIKSGNNSNFTICLFFILILVVIIIYCIKDIPCVKQVLSSFKQIL